MLRAAAGLAGLPVEIICTRSSTSTTPLPSPSNTLAADQTFTASPTPELTGTIGVTTAFAGHTLVHLGKKLVKSGADHAPDGPPAKADEGGAE